MLIEFGKDAFVRESRKLKKNRSCREKFQGARQKKKSENPLVTWDFFCPASVPSVIGGQHFCDILSAGEEVYTHSIEVLIQNSKKSR
jgi:hypothetical protein